MPIPEPWELEPEERMSDYTLLEEKLEFSSIVMCVFPGALGIIYHKPNANMIRLSSFGKGSSQKGVFGIGP